MIAVPAGTIFPLARMLADDELGCGVTTAMGGGGVAATVPTGVDLPESTSKLT
ncbi:MAG TPA: hypothetical protein VFA04_21910 [Bryobacteraceae bacterium]|nr:hypothetical protein [Bryobacteraceae bacterium]